MKSRRRLFRRIFLGWLQRRGVLTSRRRPRRRSLPELRCRFRRGCFNRRPREGLLAPQRIHCSTSQPTFRPAAQFPRRESSIACSPRLACFLRRRNRRQPESLRRRQICFPGGGLPREAPVGLILASGRQQITSRRPQHPTGRCSRRCRICWRCAKDRIGGRDVALFCPTLTSNTLGPSGEVLFGPSYGQLKIRAGAVVLRPDYNHAFCHRLCALLSPVSNITAPALPGLLKDAPEFTLVPPDKWPAQVTVFDKILASDPKDLGALVGRAAAFERNGLFANALADYRRDRRTVERRGLGAGQDFRALGYNLLTEIGLLQLQICPVARPTPY